MKLTVDLSLLLSAVKTMGAAEVTFKLSKDFSPIKPIDRELSEGKLEVSFNEIEFKTGLAGYKGRQILLYIKDHSYNNIIYSVLKDGSEGNKFHVAYCEKLDEMKRKNRIDRYVVTNKIDSQFAVSGIDKITGEIIEGETNLNVCQFCLDSINYKKFRSIPRGPKRREFVKDFKLADFFDNYSSFFNYMPAKVAEERSSGYTDDWPLISSKIREKFDYQCQQCGLKLDQHKHLLHTHHINGVKSDNSHDNLTPLCADCHRKQPYHQHMFVKHSETQEINRLRREQNIIVKENWEDIYNFSDPAMHGVIDLLQQREVALPEIAEIIKDDQGEVVAELELAWPLKKIGIAINKKTAIAGTRLGWKVYSMRLAISLINELTAKIR